MDDDDSPGPTREEVGDEYWDPPCRVCKVVDDEPNVLCELCNDAYHIACIENMKPPLPRCPEDDEWFCRACVRRGVPEVIIDRVGRDSSAHYLVKWLGRHAWDVSWEEAKTLDTAWSRKLIRQYVGDVEPSRRSIAQLLPPCHPLVDICRGRATAEAAATAAATAQPLAAVPSASAQTSGLELLTSLRTLCTQLPQHEEPLGDLMRAAARLVRVQSHPRCAKLAPWATTPDEARQPSCAAIKRAAAALAPLVTLASSLGKRKTARRQSDVQQAQKALKVRSGGLEAAPSASMSVSLWLQGQTATTPTDSCAAGDGPAQMGPVVHGSHKAPTSGWAADGDLCAALVAELQRLCARQPTPAHCLAPVALPAARVLATCGHPGWRGQQPLIDAGVQALTTLRATLDSLIGPPPPAASAAETAAAAATSCAHNAYRSFLLHLGESRNRQPASASAAEVEERAAVEFARLPPAESSALADRALQTYRARLGALPNDLAGLEKRGGGGRTNERDQASKAHGGNSRRPCQVCSEFDKRDALVCDTCGGRLHLMCLFPPVEAMPEGAWTCDDCRAAIPPPLAMPKVGDELECEVAESDAKGGGIVWKKAVVIKVLPRSTFRLMINPDEEDDFLEVYGMEDQGKEWRWPEAALEAHKRARAAATVAAAEVAAERAAATAALSLEVEAKPSELLPLVEEFYRDGICVLEAGLDALQVAQCEDAVERGYRHYMHSIKTLDLQEKLTDVGFMEIKMRSAGRYDLQLPELSSPSFAFLTTEAPWMPLVHALLGSDAVLTHFGCMLSFPGSATQPWHSDGPHVRGCGEAAHRLPFPTTSDSKPASKTSKGEATESASAQGTNELGSSSAAQSFVAPVHALNVFVPLVELTADKGPTEFVAGSHIDFDIEADSQVRTLNAGSALLFDYRLKHRGLGNHSTVERPLLYITYARPFWLDVYNFDKKRYEKLPLVEEQVSREERMLKRQASS